MQTVDIQYQLSSISDWTLSISYTLTDSTVFIIYYWSFIITLVVIVLVQYFVYIYRDQLNLSKYK